MTLIYGNYPTLSTQHLLGHEPPSSPQLETFYTQLNLKYFRVSLGTMTPHSSSERKSRLFVILMYFLVLPDGLTVTTIPF